MSNQHTSQGKTSTNYCSSKLSGRAIDIGEILSAAQLAQLCDQYEKRLPRALAEHRHLRTEWRRQFEYVFEDCMDSMRHGQVYLDKERVALASVLGVTTALSNTSLDKLNVAWGEMNDVLLATLTGADPAYTQPVEDLHLALSAVNRSIMERSKLCALWYEKALLKRFEGIRVADRKRTSRELHDWFGGNISLAIRKLELHGLEKSSDSGRGRHMADLNSILANLLEGTRRFSSGLRAQSQVSSVIGELRSFVDSFGSDRTDVTIFVDGDESLVPITMREELFMMLREGLRNIFTHSAAAKAFVILQLSRNRLCGVIQDDGCGFDMTAPPTRSTTGNGLISIRERVEVLGGSFMLTSAPQSGTRIAFIIPNPGEDHDF